MRGLIASSMLASVILLSGCAASDVSSSQGPASFEDAYDIGCPLLDASVAGNATAKQAAAWTLETFKKEQAKVLDPEVMSWIEDAKTVMTASNTDAVSDVVVRRVSQGCADNGNTLNNLGL